MPTYRMYYTRYLNVSFDDYVDVEAEDLERAEDAFNDLVEANELSTQIEDFVTINTIEIELNETEEI